MKEKEFIHFIWVIGMMFIVAMICLTLIWINYNSWTVRFEMDENTKESIESIKWEEINQQEEIWNCPILLEQGKYIFSSNGILISPSGEELNCKRLTSKQESKK